MTSSKFLAKAYRRKVDICSLVFARVEAHRPYSVASRCVADHPREKEKELGEGRIDMSCSPLFKNLSNMANLIPATFRGDYFELIQKGDSKRYIYIAHSRPAGSPWRVGCVEGFFGRGFQFLLESGFELV